MVIDEFQKLMVRYAKERDEARLGAIRFFLSKVKNKEIELRPTGETITDEVAFKVLKKLIKQINETIDLAQKGGRTEIIEKSEREKAVLMEFAAMFPYSLEDARPQ